VPKKIAAMSSKDIRKAAHTFANLHRDDAGSMLSLALNGNEQVFAKSGPPTPPAGPNNPYPTYLVELASKLPWNGLTPAIAPDRNGNRRSHNTCSEAHIWCELMSRGKNPANYTLVSFNADGNIAAPCLNCAQWVNGAFGAVYAETTSYDGHGKQKP
jgi:hypothetical protein